MNVYSYSTRLHQPVMEHNLITEISTYFSNIDYKNSPEYQI